MTLKEFLKPCSRTNTLYLLTFIKGAAYVRFTGTFEEFEENVIYNELINLNVRHFGTTEHVNELMILLEENSHE